MSVNVGVTITIHRRVKRGHEAAFEAALREFIPQSLTFPGHLGVQVHPPAPGSPSEWVVVIKFRSHEDYDSFHNSPVYQQWRARIREHLESEPRVKAQSGLENWFVLPGANTIPKLPRWKMALVTWLGVTATIGTLSVTLGPLVSDWPVALRIPVMNALVVILLTWAVMPLLTRLFRPWLYPQDTTAAKETIDESSQSSGPDPSQRASRHA